MKLMMGVRREKKDIYEAIVYEEGPLKTLLKAVKSATDGSGFDRSFITDVFLTFCLSKNPVNPG